MRICWFLFFLFLMILGPAAHAQIQPLALRKAVYTAARCQLRTPPGLGHKIPQTLIRLYRPGGDTVVGTGFLLSHKQKLFAVFPHHIAGHQGHSWDIEVMDRQNRSYRFPISISKHGGFDETHPDLSLTDLSAFKLPALESFEIGTPQLSQPAYSFGYTVGPFQFPEFLPIKRHFLTQHGWEMTTDRVIYGEKPAHALDITGYCGSPVLQLQQGTWKVVAMHIGSCVYGPENFHLNHSTVVNLPKAFALLQKVQETPPHTVLLAFNGITVEHLTKDEHVTSIEIEREGISIFWTSIDKHTHFQPGKSEEFLASQLVLQPEDRLVFTVKNAQGQPRRLEFSVP